MFILAWRAAAWGSWAFCEFAGLPGVWGREQPGDAGGKRDEPKVFCVTQLP